MSELKSSDYEAGWRLRLTFGDGSAVEGVLHGSGQVEVAGWPYSLERRLGERAYGSLDPDERITAITVLDRPSPFEMGARVCINDSPKVYTVTYWGKAPGGHWAMKAEAPGVSKFWVLAENLTLAPEPEPLTVDLWSWWADEDGTAYVCTGRAAGGPGFLFRRVDRAYALGWRENHILNNWTRLPGPPEPKPGDVYVIGDSAWQNYGGGHFETGSECTWPDVIGRHTPEQMASLRVLANIGGAS